MAGIICFKVKWPLPRSPVNQLGKRGSFARRCCKCRPVQSRLSGESVVLVVERGCRKQPSDLKRRGDCMPFRRKRLKCSDILEEVDASPRDIWIPYETNCPYTLTNTVVTT
ncbi:hypothetical protein TIFTF001_015731 [Ficus carica]|uniref:Uncharacterized protein n=1 Tax=Ficus carica TaxID=3494 RepID=A0AA88A508_FICCA|nr:hypothetical protein TIFTF001_015731 [Ficus carica]